MNPKFKSILPHLVAIATFLILSSVYFSPLFDGYSLKQSDIRQFQGMSKEIVDHEFVNGVKPLWTNSMFGGMPSYQIATEHNANWLTYIDQAIKLGLPRPVGILFISSCSMSASVTSRACNTVALEISNDGNVSDTSTIKDTVSSWHSKPISVPVTDVVGSSQVCIIIKQCIN